MPKKYLTHAVFERNASSGLELHDTASAAAVAVGANVDSGAMSVRVYECTEVEIETYTAVRVFSKEDSDTNG